MTSRRWLPAAQVAKVVMDDDRFDRDGQLSDELAMQTTERIAPASKLYQLAKLTVFLVPLVTTTSSSVVDFFRRQQTSESF